MWFIPIYNWPRIFYANNLCTGVFKIWYEIHRANLANSIQSVNNRIERSPTLSSINIIGFNGLIFGDTSVQDTAPIPDMWKISRVINSWQEEILNLSTHVIIYSLLDKEISSHTQSYNAKLNIFGTVHYARRLIKLHDTFQT